jgi:hypothetical protein
MLDGNYKTENEFEPKIITLNLISYYENKNKITPIIPMLTFQKQIQITIIY